VETAKVQYSLPAKAVARVTRGWGGRTRWRKKFEKEEDTEEKDKIRRLPEGRRPKNRQRVKGTSVRRELEGDRTNVPAAHASNPEVAWEMESLLAQRRAAIKRPSRVHPLHRRRCRRRSDLKRSVRVLSTLKERNTYKKKCLKYLVSW